jgi:hypothetical protein
LDDTGCRYEEDVAAVDAASSERHILLPWTDVNNVGCRLTPQVRFFKLAVAKDSVEFARWCRTGAEQRRARSNCWAVESERGISVPSGAMRFERERLAFKLLDTAGPPRDK